MRGKLIFGAGVGIGYVLGTRAGREKFDQITGQAKRFWENNTVQEAAGVVQTQAGRLYDGSKKAVTEQAHKMREQRHEKQEKQRHNKGFRKREVGERSRRDTEWAAPAAFPPSTTGSTPTPY
jgi:hypothetical protein